MSNDREQVRDAVKKPVKRQLFLHNQRASQVTGAEFLLQVSDLDPAEKPKDSSSRRALRWILHSMFAGIKRRSGGPRYRKAKSQENNGKDDRNLAIPNKNSTFFSRL